MDFEWDPQKAIANRRKYGVTFEEAATVFADTLSVTIGDPRRPEDRLVTIGMTRVGRLLVVVHIDRGAVMRLISARPVSARERHTYERG